MRKTILGRLLMTAALLTGVGSAVAADKGQAAIPQGDEAVAKAVRHTVIMYPYYTMFDALNFRVANGQVELTGDVTQPWKKSDIEHLVQKTPGVTSVVDEIKVLPLSDFDNSLRRQVARAILSDPVFVQFRGLAVPPIHIIVDNGRVTLTGVVDTEMQKEIAGLRANSSMSFGQVVNNLQVEHPSTKKS